MIVIVLVIIMSAYIFRREYLLCRELKDKLNRYENKLQVKEDKRKQKSD